MSNTASISVYRIREDADLNQAISYLVDELDYYPFQLNDALEQAHRIKIQAFGKDNPNPPVWLGMIADYIIDGSLFNNSMKYDLVIFVSYTCLSGPVRTFTFCGGSGRYHIADYTDRTFGIEILESIFDPNINKIKGVAEKGIIGDVLASRRFYRRARPVGYEDNFGKYYQSIDTGITIAQIRQHFPSFAAYKPKKLKSAISVSGSARIQLLSRVDLVRLLYLIRDLAALSEVKHKPIFNRTLVPLDAREDRELIAQLEDDLFEHLTNFYINPVKYPMDFDFCHSDFDTFFGATVCKLTGSGLTNFDGSPFEVAETDDVYMLGDPHNVRELIKRVEKCTEYRNTANKREFIRETLKSFQVATLDELGNMTTHGKLKEYLQLETQKEGTSYFLLDSKWYALQEQFDSTLSDKYISRVSAKMRTHSFVPKWNGVDENAYNQLYSHQPSSFCFHEVKVDHIELCDALVVDIAGKRVYLVYVKDGIGAAIRDLTAQAYIAAHVIEEEARTPLKPRLRKLYQKAVANKRIEGGKLSEDDFLRFISFKREYVLAIHAQNRSYEDVRAGNFASRIAKFSLIEFAGAMYVNNWEFSICCVES